MSVVSVTNMRYVQNHYNESDGCLSITCYHSTIQKFHFGQSRHHVHLILISSVRSEGHLRREHGGSPRVREDVRQVRGYPHRPVAQPEGGVPQVGGHPRSVQGTFSCSLWKPTKNLNEQLWNNQTNQYQEQMTRYANLRDEISHLRKVRKPWLRSDSIFIWRLWPTSKWTSGSDFEPVWAWLQGTEPRDVHKVPFPRSF